MGTRWALTCSQTPSSRMPLRPRSRCLGSDRSVPCSRWLSGPKCCPCGLCLGTLGLRWGALCAYSTGEKHQNSNGETEAQGMQGCTGATPWVCTEQGLGLWFPCPLVWKLNLCFTRAEQKPRVSVRERASSRYLPDTPTPSSPAIDACAVVEPWLQTHSTGHLGQFKEGRGSFKFATSSEQID